MGGTLEEIGALVLIALIILTIAICLGFSAAVAVKVFSWVLAL